MSLSEGFCSIFFHVVFTKSGILAFWRSAISNQSWLKVYIWSGKLYTILYWRAFRLWKYGKQFPGRILSNAQNAFMEGCFLCLWWWINRELDRPCFLRRSLAYSLLNRLFQVFVGRVCLIEKKNENRNKDQVHFSTGGWLEAPWIKKETDRMPIAIRFAA